jgi:hypothetical protein
MIIAQGLNPTPLPSHYPATTQPLPSHYPATNISHLTSAFYHFSSRSDF